MAQLKSILQLVVLALLSSCIAGSKITLTSSQSSIQPLLTPSLNLRCALEDTASSSTLVGRSVASTPTNAKFVNSIFLFRDNVDIASLSEHVPAKMLSYNPNLNVSGAIPGSNGKEKGFIEIDITYPKDNQGGNYTCQISAIDEVGHPIFYSASVDIDVTTPTINDLVQHIQTQDQNNKAQDQRNMAEIEALKRQDKNTKGDIVTLNSKLANLTAKLQESRHIESGVVNCGRLGTPGNYPKSRSMPVTFKSPYNSDPIVHLGVLDVDTHKDYHAFYEVKLTTTDTSGFTVECSVDDASYYVYDLKISWLAFP